MSDKSDAARLVDMYWLDDIEPTRQDSGRLPKNYSNLDTKEFACLYFGQWEAKPEPFNSEQVGFVDLAENIKAIQLRNGHEYCSRIESKICCVR